MASAYASIGGSTPNNFGLRRSKNAVVILVDGLGAANLRFQPGHAPFLNSHLNKSSTIECAFPSTTATSLTSLATGVAAAKHPVIGYQVFDRETRESVNLLTGWSESFSPARQTSRPISKLATAEAKKFVFCGPAEYENSGFTKATMPEATYISAKTIEERFDAISKLLKSSASTISYLYVPELDQIAHAFGSQSQKWLNKLEELDALVKNFVSHIPTDTGVLLTADHGVIDVPYDSHLFLDDLELANLKFVGGDPRVRFLYFDVENTAQAIELARVKLLNHLHDAAYVCTYAELVSAGWYVEASAEAMSLMPDLFVIAKSRVAFYHRKFAKQKSLLMIGQHGSISIDEIKVPLLRFGAFA